MARSIWSGAISFGLVNVPVKLYTATESKNVRFHEFREDTGERIRHKRVAEDSGEEVPYEDIAKGYEIEKGSYVMLSREELESVEPEKTRAIEITDFVDLDEIDPIYFQKTYFLAPADEGAKKAYGLLLAAMERTNKVGIACFVMRTKQYLGAIRPSDGVLLLETMFFADEVREVKQVENLPADIEPSDKELGMAEQLVESLAEPFQPDRYRDTHREKILEIVQRKAEGEEIVTERPKTPEQVGDLMAALQASVDAVKERRGGGKGHRAS